MLYNTLCLCYVNKPFDQFNCFDLNCLARKMSLDLGQEEISVVFNLKHPTTCLVSGPTGCGKTRFVSRLISTPGMITPKPKRIIWLYSEWQTIYSELSTKLTIDFIKNGNISQIYDTLNSEVENLIVLDDQMSSSDLSQKKQTVKLFTQGSHHRNLTVIHIVQNLFEQGSWSRTISLNSQYIVVFKNPRDSAQINYLSQQAYPRDSKFLVESYLDATLKPHSYLAINLTQECEQWMRVCSNIFPEEETQIYVETSCNLPENLVYKVIC